MTPPSLVWEVGKVKVGYPWVGGNQRGLYVITASPAQEDAITHGEQPLPGAFKDRVLEILDESREALGEGVWLRFPVRQQSGNSFGLAVAVADYLARRALDSPLARREIIATGCILPDGQVGAVQHFQEKLDDLLHHAPPGSLLLIPEENHEALRGEAAYLAVRDGLARRGVEVRRVAEVSALASLGEPARVAPFELPESTSAPRPPGRTPSTSPPHLRGRLVAPSPSNEDRGGGVFWIGLLMGLLLALLIYALFPFPVNPAEADFPPCQLLRPNPSETLLGLPWPVLDAAFDRQAVALAQTHAHTRVCRIAWGQLLPRFSPWDGAVGLSQHYAWAVFGLAAVVGVLLIPCAPPQWRRQLTLLGLLGWLAVSWILGVAGLRIVHGLEWPQRYLLAPVVQVQQAGGSATVLQATYIAALDQQLSLATSPQERNGHE